MTVFIFFLLNFALFAILASVPVQAQCPVCVITVGGGMLLAQKLGIDDLLVSIWISGLNTVIAYWLATKIKLKPFNKRTVLSFAFYLMTLAYFYFTQQLTFSSNLILGINKTLLGLTIGLLAVIAGNIIYADTKRRNHHRTLFPYAKVVFPLALLLLSTLIFKLAYHL
jgi:hypothetical protein